MLNDAVAFPGLLDAGAGNMSGFLDNVAIPGLVGTAVQPRVVIFTAQGLFDNLGYDHAPK